MILLSLRSGKEIAIRGEKWVDCHRFGGIGVQDQGLNEVNSAIMGKIHVTDVNGHHATIRAEAVDLATEIPDAEVKAQVEARRKEEEAKALADKGLS
jgi:hypothetical protein